MGIYQTLLETGLPCAYGRFKEAIEPPFLIYLGNGQHRFLADDTHYYSANKYQVEYYFINKNEEAEQRIEQTLLDAGYLFEKSVDEYIDSEDVFVIYYYTSERIGKNG